MHAMGMLEGYDKSVRGIPWEVGWANKICVSEDFIIEVAEEIIRVSQCMTVSEESNRVCLRNIMEKLKEI